MSYVIDELLDKRKKAGKIEYLVRWEGFGEEVSLERPLRK